jgi:isopenicillin N synthase-like dioxygenase
MEIPVIDVSGLIASGDNVIQKAETIRAIGDACRTIGFFYISNHGVPVELQGGFCFQSSFFFSCCF